jgi:hypothetical protein
MGTKIIQSFNTIIATVEGLIGKNVLQGIKIGQCFDGGRDGKALMTFLSPILFPEIEKMKAETLGRYCEYATPHGVNDDLSWCIVAVGAFINHTGIMDVRDDDFSREKHGRDLLEEMALAVLVCIARDVILQDEWWKEVNKNLGF